MKTNGNKLKGKIAFITGGTSAIGLAIARKFVDEDAQVVIADLDSAQYLYGTKNRILYKTGRNVMLS